MKPCDKVLEFLDSKSIYIGFEILLKDYHGGKYDIVVNHTHLLIPGEELMDKYKDRCYLAIFANQET